MKGDRQGEGGSAFIKVSGRTTLQSGFIPTASIPPLHEVVYGASLKRHMQTANRLRSQRILQKTAWILFNTMLAAASAVNGAEPSANASGQTNRPRTAREIREAQNPKPAAPEPVVVDGVMRSAMGYLRVFARITYRNQALVGQPAHDVLQRVRALEGDYMDLNLAASSGPQNWWTAVLDTGADGHSINQDTVARFGLRTIGDVFTRVSGVDGEELKGKSGAYALSLSGSDGHLNEWPSQPFIPAEAYARFNVEMKPYQPQVRANPDGMNLIGMSAIRNFNIEVETDNATTAMLSEPLDMTSSRAFEESLHGITAGPRVRLLPPAFRPTNNVVRIPLRYVDSARLDYLSRQPAPAAATTPLVMGVRFSHLGRQTLGNVVFDTGSSVTMISRKLAFRLGLLPTSGPAYDKPDFRDPVIGVNNHEVTADGYVIDSLEILSVSGQIVQWRNVPVLVHDVAIRQADGRFVVQDGILGSNLFLASTNGQMGEHGLKVRPAPFLRYWFSGPLGEVWLQLPPIHPGT